NMGVLKFFSAFALISASFRLLVGYNAPHCSLLPHGNLLEIRTKSIERIYRTHLKVLKVKNEI
ncbi:MAG: hypothetical protein II633_00525, partial [Bacteroidales bacterium]|nr:hypothetical protein [Bacteroidales bacterium]